MIRVLLFILTLLTILYTAPFATAKAPADNSAGNAVDAPGNTVTPVDQASGSAADQENTRRLRQALVSESNLSTYAQNVKIITLEGKTYLRGVVNSTAERRKVASIARRVLGRKTTIANQITVAR